MAEGQRSPGFIKALANEEMLETGVLTPAGLPAGETNPDTISQAEAEAGTATTDRTFTAQRVKQAIDALAGGDQNELDKYSDRMVAYWRCQESSGNLLDAISGLALVPSGTVTYENAFSNSLNGVGLDAATAKCVIEDTSWAPLGDFTLAFWYQGSARTSGTMLSFSSGALTNYLFDEDASGLFQYDGSTRRCSGPISLHDDTAKFIVFQRQGISDSVYGFFNGSLGTLVREGTARELQEYDRFSIAAQPPDSDNGQQGFYSHIGFWDINLPPKSVLAAYNAGAGADYFTGADL